MSNPHPTKSKPCKIGRKHTGAPSIRVNAKKQKALKIQRAIQKNQAKRLKNLIASYWRGEIDIYPINH